MIVNEQTREVFIADDVSLNELAIIVNMFPEGEYKFLIHESD